VPFNYSSCDASLVAGRIASGTPLGIAFRPLGVPISFSSSDAAKAAVMKSRVDWNSLSQVLKTWRTRDSFSCSNARSIFVNNCLCTNNGPRSEPATAVIRWAGGRTLRFTYAGTS
jgi:hypothetical protein